MGANETLLNIFIGGNYHGDYHWSRKKNGSDNCYKVYYMHEGDVIIYDEKKEYTLSSGHIYLLNGFKMAGFKSEQQFAVGWLHFTPQALYLNRALSELPIVTDLSQTAFEDIKQLLIDTAKIIATQGEINYRYLQLEGLLTFTMAKILEEYAIHIPTQNTHHKSLNPAIKIIDHNLDKEITLTSLAKSCKLSTTHFHHLFTNEYKITPMKYVLQCKMKKASELLLTTNLSIKEISYRLGYDEPAYFSRVFSKYYSLSPNAFRQAPKP